MSPASDESPTRSVVERATLSDVTSAATTAPMIMALSTRATKTSMSVKPSSTRRIGRARRSQTRAGGQAFID